jgi:nicotinamidase-related amidase
MKPEQTAVILVGFQNDYFSPTGILRTAVENGTGTDRVLRSTLDFLQAIQNTKTTIISTPILFTDNYSELSEPVGILQTIKSLGAFRQDTPGAQTIAELEAMGDRIITVPGKRGLNAFSNTQLDQTLKAKEIKDIILAGVVSSICIDSTGRAAHEKGFRVSILSDCTAGRTEYEQSFYCNDIFPLYAEVVSSKEAASRLRQGGSLIQ